jgi:hypothetical protein
VASPQEQPVLAHDPKIARLGDRLLGQRRRRVIPG